MPLTQEEWGLQYMGPNVTGLCLSPGCALPHFSEESGRCIYEGKTPPHRDNHCLRVSTKKKEVLQVWVSKAHLSQCPQLSNGDAKEIMPTITTSHSS